MPLTCLACNESKPDAEFSVDRKRPTGRHPYCKMCRRRQERERYQNNAEAREGQRWRQIKHTYGLTQDEWLRMLDEQGGGCAICLRPLRRTLGGDHRKDSDAPVTDHCHMNDRVRGILCHSCNLAIGFFPERREVYERAMHYLGI